MFLSSFFQCIISDVAWPTATKLSHMLGSECDLRNWVRNFGALPKHEHLRPDLRQLPNLTAGRMKQDFVNQKKYI